VGLDPAAQRLEAGATTLASAIFELTLFVNGASAPSARAIRNLQAMCEAHLDGRYELTIVDVNQNPELARGRRVLATPTLLKGHPLPERMLVGDLSDHQGVLLALGMRAAHPADAEAGE
jgi:circadian clock protein KaiB